jgi:hypothetical protein
VPISILSADDITMTAACQPPEFFHQGEHLSIREEDPGKADAHSPDSIDILSVL